MRLLIVTSVAAFLQPLFILRSFEHQSIFLLNFLCLSFVASVKKCLIVDVRQDRFLPQSSTLLNTKKNSPMEILEPYGICELCMFVKDFFKSQKL